MKYFFLLISGFYYILNVNYLTHKATIEETIYEIYCNNFDSFVIYQDNHLLIDNNKLKQYLLNKEMTLEVNNDQYVINYKNVSSTYYFEVRKNYDYE